MAPEGKSTAPLVRCFMRNLMKLSLSKPWGGMPSASHSGLRVKCVGGGAVLRGVLDLFLGSLLGAQLHEGDDGDILIPRDPPIAIQVNRVHLRAHRPFRDSWGDERRGELRREQLVQEAVHDEAAQHLRPRLRGGLLGEPRDDVHGGDAPWAWGPRLEPTHQGMRREGLRPLHYRPEGRRGLRSPHPAAVSLRPGHAG